MIPLEICHGFGSPLDTNCPFDTFELSLDPVGLDNYCTDELLDYHGFDDPFEI